MQKQARALIRQTLKMMINYTLHSSRIYLSYLYPILVRGYPVGVDTPIRPSVLYGRTANAPYAQLLRIDVSFVSSVYRLTGSGGVVFEHVRQLKMEEGSRWNRVLTLICAALASIPV
jgi:hypothetical protein